MYRISIGCSYLKCSSVCVHNTSLLTVRRGRWPRLFPRSYVKSTMTRHKTDKRNAEENPIGRSLFFSCSPKNQKKNTTGSPRLHRSSTRLSRFFHTRHTILQKCFPQFPAQTLLPPKLDWNFPFAPTFCRIPLLNRGIPDPPPTNRVPSCELFRNIRHFRFSFSFS